MSLIAPSRRGLLRMLPALLAAPAIVRASSLMPISVPADPKFVLWGRVERDAIGLLTETNEILADMIRWNGPIQPLVRIAMPVSTWRRISA